MARNTYFFTHCIAGSVCKRERRQVLALNKLGDAAIGVRREFVRELLARKVPPKGAAIFVAGCLARDKFLLDQHHGDDIAAELLGVDGGSAIRKLVDSLGTGGDARAQIITLALVLGSMEARLCGLSRCVRCSLAFPRLVWRVLGTSCLWHLPANGGRCV